MLLMGAIRLRLPLASQNLSPTAPPRTVLALSVLQSLRKTNQVIIMATTLLVRRQSTRVVVLRAAPERLMLSPNQKGEGTQSSRATVKPWSVMEC